MDNEEGPQLGKKHYIHASLALAVLSALVVVTCGSSEDASPTGSLPHESVLAPRENAEAERAAVWLSGELVAPEELYLTIKSDLEAIRTGFADNIIELDIGFKAPWEFSEILVGVTDAGKERLRDGNWPEFSELNDRFHLVKLDTTRLARTNLTILGFEGRQHPDRISEPYDALDGIRYAEPNHLCCDWSNVYPWRLDDGMTYLWRSAWGDCPAGCINSRFWYFRVTDSGVEYVGSFELRTDPEPAWWDEAKTAYEFYRGF